jgi:hypothetical protein
LAWLLMSLANLSAAVKAGLPKAGMGGYGTGHAGDRGILPTHC